MTHIALVVHFGAGEFECMAARLCACKISYNRENIAIALSLSLVLWQKSSILTKGGRLRVCFCGFSQRICLQSITVSAGGDRALLLPQKTGSRK